MDTKPQNVPDLFCLFVFVPIYATILNLVVWQLQDCNWDHQIISKQRFVSRGNLCPQLVQIWFSFFFFLCLNDGLGPGWRSVVLHLTLDGCLGISYTIWLCHGCPKSHLVLGCCMAQQLPACSNCRTSASCHQMAAMDLREEILLLITVQDKCLTEIMQPSSWRDWQLLDALPVSLMECLYTWGRVIVSEQLHWLKRQDCKWEEKKSNLLSPSSGKLLMTLTAAANFASRLRLSSSSSAMLGPNKDGMKERVVTSRARR